MKVGKILVTGSSGLIGSETAAYFDARGHRVLGVDNNMRADFFGPDGDTRTVLERLRKTTQHFMHLDLDVRDREQILAFVAHERPDVVIHCAAQPSHDLAARRPFDDFDINAVGTLNLLEGLRRANPEATFVLLSTNKVYGDAPNELPLKELSTRWDYARPEHHEGVPETMRVDQCLHSLFGASKLAADVVTQEYGRYFGMPTVCLRGGCLTGPKHRGAELHGFLSYLVKCALSGRTYRIFGYKGKQVRDNIHSEDVVCFIEAFIRAPRVGEVYNLGGGRANSISILEAFERLEALTGNPVRHEYVERARIGDHICYISDLSKARRDYPEWELTRDLDSILRELVESYQGEVEGTIA